MNKYLAALCFLLAACAPSHNTPILDCGSELVYGTGEGYNTTARDCILDAFQTCTPAQFSARHYTIEGDPIITNVQITKSCQINLFIDSKDRFGVLGVANQTCTEMQLNRIEPPADVAYQFESINFLNLSHCTGSSEQVTV